MSDTPFRGSARLSRRSLLKTSAGATAAVAAAGVGFPAILRAQEQALRIGHLTPLTGFLGQLGVYGQNAAKMAVEEINAAGGITGRKVELLTEDSVNPGTAVTKTDQLIGRDKVVALLGEIS
jgi:branched-chain amino acid transport system substrate-binding protein